MGGQNDSVAALNSPATVLSDDKIEKRKIEKNENFDSVDMTESNHLEQQRDEGERSKYAAFLIRHKRPLVHTAIFVIFTGWWLASIIRHHHDRNWVIPFLFWLAIMLRLLFYYVSANHVATPIRWIWANTASRVHDVVPVRFRSLAGGLLTAAVIMAGALASEEIADNTRANRGVSLCGLAFIVFVFWATSKSRHYVNWRTVCVGILSQYIIGLFVLRTKVGFDIFQFIANRASDLLSFARAGVAFLTTAEIGALTFFFLSVIPALIFFISLVQVLYCIGFIQWFVQKVAVFVNWALAVSGAEAVVAASTPFVGQGEAAMLVQPFVPYMTKSELHQVMTCGFATISGAVLIGYIHLGLNPEALVSSCIMSIPASLAISKLRYPETEETLTKGDVTIPNDEKQPGNALHAFADGAVLGLKVGGTIVAALLCVIAFVGLINGLLGWWGSYLDLIGSNKLSLQLIFGYLFYPLPFLLGVPRDADMLKVSRLIAEKVIVNEYSAFNMLANDVDYSSISPRSRLIATYAICGFGNVGSLGVQIAILGQIAPRRAAEISRLAFSALICGVMATLTSASMAGLVITTQIDHFTSTNF